MATSTSTLEKLSISFLPPELAVSCPPSLCRKLEEIEEVFFGERKHLSFAVRQKHHYEYLFFAVFEMKKGIRVSQHHKDKKFIMKYYERIWNPYAGTWHKDSDPKNAIEVIVLNREDNKEIGKLTIDYNYKKTSKPTKP